MRILAVVLLLMLVHDCPVDRVKQLTMKNKLSLLQVITTLFLVVMSAHTQADTKLNDGTILPDKPHWVVSYIEVMPQAKENAAALISLYVKKTSAVKGNLRIEALQRIGRDNHFIVLEAWADPDVWSGFAESPASSSFREALEPLLYAPYDHRSHVGLLTAKPHDIPVADENTIYVITHADLIPPEQFAPCKRAINPEGPCGNDLLTSLAKSTRQHAGNLRFDILTQTNRGNHMTVVEMWSSAESQAAHQLHQDKKDFRYQVGGINTRVDGAENNQYIPDALLGSLWDERLYKKLGE